MHRRKGLEVHQRNPRISWVIPIIPRDTVYFEGLLEGIKKQSIPPFEVVIVASGFSRLQLNPLRLAVSQSPLPIRLVKRRLLRSAAPNRNLGIKRATGDFVSFFDADDIPHPLRNELLLKAIRERGSASRKLAIFHGYEFLPRDLWNPSKRDMPETFTRRAPEKLAVATNLAEKTQKRLDDLALQPPRKRVYTLFAFSDAEFDPTHGHMTVSRSLLNQVEFPNRPLKRDEDAVFANLLYLKTKPKFLMIDFPLTVYRNGWQDELKAQKDLEWRYPNQLHRFAKSRLEKSSLFLKRFRRRVIRTINRISK